MLVVLTTGLLSAGSNPFVGRWKLNIEKSDLSGETLKFESAGSNMVRYDSGGLTYNFSTDGTEHPGLFGH